MREPDFWLPHRYINILKYFRRLTNVYTDFSKNNLIPKFLQNKNKLTKIEEYGIFIFEIWQYM